MLTTNQFMIIFEYLPVEFKKRQLDRNFAAKGHVMAVIETTQDGIHVDQRNVLLQNRGRLLFCKKMSPLITNFINWFSQLGMDPNTVNHIVKFSHDSKNHTVLNNCVWKADP